VTLRINSNKAPTVTATDVNSPTPNRNGPISSLVMYQSIPEILGSQLMGLKDLDIAIFIVSRFRRSLLQLKLIGIIQSRCCKCLRLFAALRMTELCGFGISSNGLTSARSCRLSNTGVLKGCCRVLLQPLMLKFGRLA